MIIYSNYNILQGFLFFRFGTKPALIVSMVIAKAYVHEPSRIRRREKQPVPLDLEKVHKKNGYYDGKIFYSESKVTYTLLLGEEVVVLHFDLSRNALYYKGHHLTHMRPDENTLELLTQFKQCLQDNPKTQKFVKPFEKVVSQIKNTPADE